ncbi:MAG: dTDP-4-dehydrorhamnose reductase [Pseudomonadota bacterium]
MKILLFGANGQVGRCVKDLIAAQQIPEGTGPLELVTIDRSQADLTETGSAARAIETHKPAAIINAAAYTAVDKAEDETALCAQINAHAPGEMATAAQAVGARFVHISTDYVFDGSGDSPLTEDAPTNPLGVYGKTKLEGEMAVLAACPGAAILRTSWVYSPYGGNFVKTMLRLAETRDRLTIVADQIGGPTPADAIASACLKIAQQKSGQGLYHFQGAPAVSWADFARAIFLADKKSVDVVDIPTSEYPTPATRPLYTVLDCRRIAADFGIDQPDWRAGLPALIDVLSDQET